MVSAHRPRRRRTPHPARRPRRTSDVPHTSHAHDIPKFCCLAKTWIVRFRSRGPAGTQYMQGRAQRRQGPQHAHRTSINGLTTEQRTLNQLVLNSITAHNTQHVNEWTVDWITTSVQWKIHNPRETERGSIHAKTTN